MADIKPAKAGDKLSERARKKLALYISRLRRTDVFLDEMPTHVVAKNPANKDGQWVCIDCGEPLQHNMGAWGHCEAHPTHRLGWRNTSGEIEEP